MGWPPRVGNAGRKSRWSHPMSSKCFKVTHDSQAQAEYEAKQMKIKYPEETRPFQVYQCVFCGKWHTGRGR